MAHEEIHRELAECQESGEFVAYHQWGDDPSIFRVGIVRALTETKATFETIDPRGRMESRRDGVPLRLIHTLDRGTRYLWRLRTLHQLEPSEAPEREVRKASEVRILLEEAASAGAIVRIWMSADESDDVLVLSVGEETATVSSVFDAGPTNGRTVVRLRRIVRARWGKAEVDDTRVHRYGVASGFS